MQLGDDYRPPQADILSSKDDTIQYSTIGKQLLLLVILEDTFALDFTVDTNKMLPCTLTIGNEHINIVITYVRMTLNEKLPSSFSEIAIRS